MQIHRHFVERQDFEFVDVSGVSGEIWEQWIGASWANNKKVKQWIWNSKLHRYLLAAAYTTRLGHSAGELVERAAARQPDAIVTVAYGRTAFVAQKVAERLRLPLVTFFHDWWPDLVPKMTGGCGRWLDRQFRLLARLSDLVLAVSQELLREIGPHPNAVILRPVPGSWPLCSGDDGAHSGAGERRLLVYAGVLQGGYGEMVLDLATKLLATPNAKWKMRVYGENDWSDRDRQRMAAAGVLGGYLPQGPRLFSALQEADAYLTVMDFGNRYRRRARTSFPSKLLDYCTFGKPLVVWGPSYCSAASFANENKSAMVVVDPSPPAVIAALSSLVVDVNERNRLSMAAANLAQTVFNAANIHASMKYHIMRLVRGI